MRRLALTVSLSLLALCGVVGVAEEPDAGPIVPALVTAPTPFIGITPCRIVDTRDASRPPGYGPPSLSAGTPRSFTVGGQCGIPAGAQAVSLNVTSVNPTGNGYLVLYPQGGAQPGVSTLNFLDRTVANAAIVPLGDGDGITVAAGVKGTDLLIDVNGYYKSATVGTWDVFTGVLSGKYMTTGLYDTGFGFGALYVNTTGESNTAFGYGTLSSNQTGSGNTAFGASALAANQSGNNNNALGANALAANLTGSENVAVGSGALMSGTTGTGNTAIGYSALKNSTGSFNTAAGTNAGINLTAGNNNTYLGSPGGTVESFTLRIGDPSVHTHFFIGGVRGVTTTLPDAVPVLIDSTNKVGTMSSSIRYKEDVHEMGAASEAVMRLRPVSFLYKGQADPLRQYGLIAEEVEKLLPELVVHGADGDVETVLYHELPAMLLNEWQKQQRELARQEDEIRELERLIAKGEEERSARQRRIEELLGRIGRLESR